MSEQLSRLLAPLTNRVKLMIGRCILLAVYDNKSIQEVQVDGVFEETLDQREHFQDYGFTSHPNPGAEGLVLALGGMRNHSVIIAIDDRRFRLTGLAQGEVAMYDDLGQRAHFKRDGLDVQAKNIHLRATDEDGVIRLDGAGIEIHGRNYVQTDVHGKGSRETWAGGTTYDADSWQTGATGGSSTEHGLDQPHVPSTHPEGP